jgi:eukaryotic-like serine/threonine-protein kinase
MKACESTIPVPKRSRLQEAAERVLRLYDAWGKPDRAAGWRLKLGLADLPADVFARP